MSHTSEPTYDSTIPSVTEGSVAGADFSYAHYKATLRRLAYPSATLYLAPPSEAQLTRQNHTRRRPQDEIRYVETNDFDFLVDPQALSRAHLTQSETMSLIWGGLGKVIPEVAAEHNIKPSTCRTYREKIFWKLGAVTMAQAVAAAFEQRVLAAIPDVAYPALALTPREHEVLSVLSHSKTQEEVGAKMYLTRGTVRTHTQHLLKANRLANCAHATFRAYLAGQLPLETEDY